MIQEYDRETSVGSEQTQRSNLHIEPREDAVSLAWVAREVVHSFIVTVDDTTQGTSTGWHRSLEGGGGLQWTAVGCGLVT